MRTANQTGHPSVLFQTKRKRTWQPILVIVAFAAAAPTCAAQSQPNRAGDIRAAIPSDYLFRTGASPVTAAPNDPVYWQDTLRTDSSGRVRVGLLDGSILNIGSASSMVISKHDPATQQTQIDLEYGHIRADVAHIAKPGGSFEIRTPVAATGVVGTSFDLSSTADRTLVFCRDGSVRVRNVDDRVPGAVVIHAGEFTEVRRGMPPTPPTTASPQQSQESGDATTILPGTLNWSRAELSSPPPGCGQSATLVLRAWTKTTEAGKQVEIPVDPQFVTGNLILGAANIPVEGSRTGTIPIPTGNAPAGSFVPSGTSSPIPTKVWTPLPTTEGKGWRAPRAIFEGSAFYVLGPVGAAHQLSFEMGGQRASQLWAGSCGAGFLAPQLPGGLYQTSVKLDGATVAEGEMNLIQTTYPPPVPAVLVRGQESQFFVEVHGLTGLEPLVQNRPILMLVVTNRTPAVIGNLRAETRDAKVSGESITCPISSRNMDDPSTFRLHASGRARASGVFDFAVDFHLDDDLALPKNPMRAMGAVRP